jgi:hypothetical protein
MLSVQVQDALSVLAAAGAQKPALYAALHTRWRGAGGPELPDEIRGAADRLDEALPALTRSESDRADLVRLFDEPAGEIVLTWCAASAARRDARMSELLGKAAGKKAMREFAVAAARDRLIEGPLLDALACAPLLGTGKVFSLPENAEACARMEILIWEAGASALAVPELGHWIWKTRETFDAMIAQPAHGSLRGRVLAARCLEVSVGGMSPMTDPELVGRTLQVLQPLLLHPEPLVWVHAARALGRLTERVEQLEGTLLDWALGDTPLLRQRAITAFGSLPQARLRFLASQLETLVTASSQEAYVIAALAAATPYLFFERRDVWDRLAARIVRGDGGAIAARALARGLASLWRRGMREQAVEAPLRRLRETARRAKSSSLDEARRWLEVVAVTDPIDDAERDPLDLELGLENLVRVGAQYDDEEADARAARFAGSLERTLEELKRIVMGEGSLRHRASAINAYEGCARSLALRLWEPLLATRAVGERVDAPSLEETWKTMARAPSEIIDSVKQRRLGEDVDPDEDVPLEVLAIRLGGYALDACGEDSGRGRGPTAHDTCLWLRKLEGLADGSRDLPAPLKGALSTLLWRIVDTTRGTALGEIDDVAWLGPFAAWWALVIDRPALLLQLGTALPMMAEGALVKCCKQADALRMAVASNEEDGAWGYDAEEAMSELNALDTELAKALSELAYGLEKFAGIAGPNPKLEEHCLDLVLRAERLRGALADPVKALHDASEGTAEDSLSRAATENAPRVAALLARAIRARELSMMDVWFSSLGPVTSALVERAVRGAVKRTPPPPPQPKKKEPTVIEGYELKQRLGEGGLGSVWLVRKPGADRFFVLKIPKSDALAQATEFEREGILASFVEEANALAGLYHPNVANIIDRGVSGDVPFLVLELLVGADLKAYSAAKLMSFFELRSVVPEACAGLHALHEAGLVHRDVKPANLWLRLPLGREKFDPDKHRDPARAQPLATVVIDFGMVRSMKVGADVAGRFVAGTAGYIAPEQVLDPVELDPRCDVYSLAGTIYNVTTGRAFFDDIEDNRERIIAHMKQDPFEDAERLRPFPTALAKLMRAATAHDFRDRPRPLEFGRAFAAAL